MGLLLPSAKEEHNNLLTSTSDLPQDMRDCPACTRLGSERERQPHASAREQCYPALWLSYTPNSKKNECKCKRHIRINTCLIQKHFETVTVTVISRKLTQMTFKMLIGNQWT